MDSSMTAVSKEISKEKSFDQKIKKMSDNLFSRNTQNVKMSKIHGGGLVGLIEENKRLKQERDDLVKDIDRLNERHTLLVLHIGALVNRTLMLSNVLQHLIGDSASIKVHQTICSNFLGFHIAKKAINTCSQLVASMDTLLKTYCPIVLEQVSVYTHMEPKKIDIEGLTKDMILSDEIPESYLSYIPSPNNEASASISQE